jgi:hypothetical protein
MKILYILVADGGDGSYSLRYTFDTELIHKLEHFNGDGSRDAGFDGDGFNPNILTVPDDSTYESLGISKYSVVNAEDYEGLV